MTVLVTGGCGFVGLNVLEALRDSGERVIAFDKHEPPRVAREMLSAAPLITFVSGNVCDVSSVEALLLEHEVDAVIHLATVTAGAVREREDPQSVIQVNVNGTVSVLQAAKSAGCRRVIYVGSGSAYGRTWYCGVPLEEEISCSRPDSIYGITKLAGELIALRLAKLLELDVRAVRLGSVLGPWEHETGVRDRMSPYLQLARTACRGERAVLPNREVRRDWIYSRDVASGLVQLLHSEAPRFELYHLSSGLDWSNGMIRWCEILTRWYPNFEWRRAGQGEEATIIDADSRDRAMMRIDRLVDDLGFRPQFGPAAAFEDYAAWLALHRSCC